MYQFILSRVNYSHKSTDVLSYITIIQTTTTFLNLFLIMKLSHAMYRQPPFLFSSLPMNNDYYHTIILK